ncbi:MAG: cytochrome c biogenesis protein [Phycisphaerae bacterium]
MKQTMWQLGDVPPNNGTVAARRPATLYMTLVGLLACASPSFADVEFPTPDRAKELDAAVDWSQAKLIVVQDSNVYKTFDAFAADALYAMYGKEHFPGLSPLASLMEWLFNPVDYADTPLVKIKERGLRLDLSATLSDDARFRIIRTGYMTPREMFHPDVLDRMAALAPRFDTRSAMARVRRAEFYCKRMPLALRMVPNPLVDEQGLWYSPLELQSNAALLGITNENASMPQLEDVLRKFGTPVKGITPKQATVIYGNWRQLGDAWRSGDAAGVETALNRFAEVLPTLAREGTYLSPLQRTAFSQYYGMGKFAWGYWLYLFGFLFGVVALVTRWSVPWWITLLFTCAALGVHCYGLGLRWLILGRIPNANMYEAITFATAGAILTIVVLELFFRTRLLLVAATVTGFFALIVGHFVVPGGGSISSIMNILDDLMLRIHTTLITISYVMIFLAGVIAFVYLFSYYFLRAPVRSVEGGFLFGLGGLMLVVATQPMFERLTHAAPTVLAGPSKIAPNLGWGFVAVGALAALLLLALPKIARHLRPTIALSLIVIAIVFSSLGWLPRGGVVFIAYTMLSVGLLWAFGTIGAILVRQFAQGREQTVLEAPGVGRVAIDQPLEERPIMAGALPGDERTTNNLPHWLNNFDWIHLIILNLVFIMLFVGTILGAVWADYAWGRPWGWDPKEVFAMNTWIIYVLLIHTRLVVKKRGLWTAWVSVIGTAMMAFNWWVVNTYIVGIHSYA